MIEKGKGPVLGKLQTIELFEADLQFLIRLFVGVRNDDNIEKDNRLSVHSYGSRKHFSIEMALLEKRLLYDISKCNGKQTIHLISDLEACYDQQLPTLGGMVEEVLGVDRRAIKVFSKTIESLRHRVCTSFGVSDKSYRGRGFSLVGTG